MKLTVALIVKNEEVMLAGCLDSINGADELVIIDTGSTDKTIEIAKRYTDKIFTDYTWEDHFAKARNHAISKCTGDWIFTIDADDRLEKDGIAKLRKVVEMYPDEDCFDVRYISVKGDQEHKLPVLYKRRNDIYWKDAAHNCLSKTAKINSGIIIRFGYSPAHAKDSDRTFRILKKAVKEDPTKPRGLFYLSREYHYKKEWVNCIAMTEQYLKVAIWGPEIADAWLRKARCLWALNKGEEARSACLEALKVNMNFKEACLFMAEMCGPINRDRWLFNAELADNSKILFLREKIEKDAAYYEKLNDTEPRYDHLYEAVGKIIEYDRMLDIGCGQGSLSVYIKNYSGFDVVPNPYQRGDIYTHALGDYDAYVLLEVLEHLTKDIDVVKRIPVGKKIVFSVPSFDDPGHVRVYTKESVIWRYRDLIKISKITRFNFDDKNRKWKTDHPATLSYISLCEGRRI